MHATEWHFTDARHLTQEWHLYENGKETRVSRPEYADEVTWAEASRCRTPSER